MKWKIEVSYKPETPDAIGQGILQDIADLGLTGVESVHTVQIYWIEGDINSHTIERIGAELLADPVTQNYVYSRSDNHTPKQGDGSVWTIEVRLKPGVTDAVGDSVLKGLRDMGVPDVQTAQTGQKYRIHGDLDQPKLEMIAQQLLANDVIQIFEIWQG
ncbi:hypothetical protein C6502_13700 [Candidatus Poribacteria bacterium]|nr:MAG: hypothetical protein C6502_13700 [Candidatus Poribacteria bacterium]